MGDKAEVTSAPTVNRNTSSDNDARMVGNVIVFKSDRNATNQHIWNQGEGSGDSDDNIYLRTDASGNLYFGWGRSGSLNECRLLTSINSSTWYGVYIAHNGQRLSGSNATPSNLAGAFDIRITTSNDSFVALGQIILPAPIGLMDSLDLEWIGLLKEISQLGGVVDKTEVFMGM